MLPRMCLNTMAQRCPHSRYTSILGSGKLRNLRATLQNEDTCALILEVQHYKGHVTVQTVVSVHITCHIFQFI
jgi:hypothetical protein